MRDHLATLTLWCLSLLTASGCSAPDDPTDAGADAERDADAESDAGDSDAEAPEDTEPDAKSDSDGPPQGFSGRFQAPSGATGEVILRLTPARGGGEPMTFALDLDTDFHLPALADGRYGVHAWVDEDADGQWDGIWEGDGEPTARFGVTLPRQDFLLPLRTGVPQPVLDGEPGWLELYRGAWEMAASHIQAGTPANGFAHHFMDEAFSDQLFQWDTCFMMVFGRYGADTFPVMESLDNFYGTQREDGYICRVVNERDGQPQRPSDPAEPWLNPPLFTWVELLWARQTGDLSRIEPRLQVFERYHGWIDTNVRTGPGLYYTSMLGSGMDNAPRERQRGRGRADLRRPPPADVGRGRGLLLRPRLGRRAADRQDPGLGLAPDRRLRHRRPDPARRTAPPGPGRVLAAPRLPLHYGRLSRL